MNETKDRIKEPICTTCGELLEDCRCHPPALKPGVCPACGSAMERDLFYCLNCAAEMMGG